MTLKSPRRRKWKKRRIFRCTSLKQTPLQLDVCDFPWQFMRPIVCHCCMNESMTHIPLVKTKQSYRLLHRLLRIEPWCAGIMTLNMRLWNRGFLFFARTLNVITHYFTEKQTKSQKVQKSSDKSSSLSSSLLSSSPNNSAIALTDKPSGHSLGIYLP